MSHPRAVSPLGASKFERPYVPAMLPRSTSTSKNTSPTSPTTASSMTGTGSHASNPSSASSGMRTDATPHSRTNTATTAPSSAHGSLPPSRAKEVDVTSPACSLPPSEDQDADLDAWFARFRSDPSLPLHPSDDCPDRATLAAVYDLPLYAADNTSRPFGSLYDPAYALHSRQLIIFVRHFYCGACQAYLQCLSESVTKEEYFSIPVPTSIVVIGCGKPDLIPQYRKFTGCPFPIFADPSRQLFRKLGMVISLSIGPQPDYMRDISAPAWLAGQVRTIRESLRDPEGIRKRDVVRGGNPMQIGGEFLFEEGEVVWCHRMRSMRGHAEVGVLRKVLGLDE